MGTTPWEGLRYVSNAPDSPLVFVTWTDMHLFISVLNGITGKTLRMPSEAEWEYACRAGTTTSFYWGDDVTYSEGDENCWWCYNTEDLGKYYAHSVGQKLPNAWGLYDMSGNALECCEDDYWSDYTDAPVDGSARIEKPRLPHRVGRGGMWGDSGPRCRSASRLSVPPYLSCDWLGLRLAR